MLADAAAALGLKNVRTTVTNACAEPETPAERAGKQLSPCLRHIKGGPNAPVCFLKAPHNSSCTRSFAGTMRTFGFPRGALHINANSLPINSELGRDHSWIPVTHTKTSQDPLQVGTWFHYMPGCSDTTWNVGRTLLARNKCDTALQLEMRAHNVSRHRALLRLALKLAFDRDAVYRHPRAAASALLLPVNADGSENVTGIADALDRCAAGVFGHSDASLLPAQRSCPAGPSEFGCLRKRDPAIPLIEVNVLDMMSAAILDRELKGTPRALDTVQQHNRCDKVRTVPALLKHPFCWAFTEIWDVRDFSGTSEHGVLGHLNGTACEPSDGWPQCFACKGSETEEACVFKCSMAKQFVKQAPEEAAYSASGDGKYLKLSAGSFLTRNGPGGVASAFRGMWSRSLATVPSLRERGRLVHGCNESGCVAFSREISEALREG
jgi:hypothetical protein